ncbi:acyl transferase/acyl hydrolase/lysophospholipase [Phakopsora pachyrhizi]|nr:acyl transferase/acyl hydrolase/lysophospholipase [Phakopsora pachyrhizi]
MQFCNAQTISIGVGLAPSTPSTPSLSHGKIKTPKRSRDIVREGWAYHISRWPLLVIISVAFVFEFIAYVLVRQIVRLVEKPASWRSRFGKLKGKLHKAKNYEEWKRIASELDETLGYERWKRHPMNAYYDSTLVKRVVESLGQLRRNRDADGVKAVLEVCLRGNFAGIESFRLYSESFIGTKTLVEAYVDEVERCLVYMRETDQISNEDKIAFFRRTSKNLGTTALCLSGGATFGYYHLGVIRALLDAKLIPTVVTGTSAGSLVAAFLCTHTDEELDQLLVPELAAMITACEDPLWVWIPRFFRTGARFDTVAWAKKATFFTRGSLTFLEAFERTGRILNVSVTPHDIHSPTTLLNYITAPNCVIFSAVLASSAVPGVLNPVVLLEKTKDGEVRPWQFQGKLKDGSLRVDVPLESLHLYFKTSFSIVSQVNPHVHIFFFQPRGSPGSPVVHRKGKGWRGGFFLSALEQFLKIELTKNFRVIRDLELLPESGGHSWSAVFLQKFEGSVTVWPKSRLKDWINMLSDPDEKELARMMDVGMRVTWPKIHMIENRLKIERQVLKGRRENKKSAEPIIVNSQQDQGSINQGLKLIDMKVDEGMTSGSEFEGEGPIKTNGIEDRIERKARMRRDRRIWNRKFSQKSSRNGVNSPSSLSKRLLDLGGIESKGETTEEEEREDKEFDDGGIEKVEELGCNSRESGYDSGSNKELFYSD